MQEKVGASSYLLHVSRNWRNLYRTHVRLHLWVIGHLRERVFNLVMNKLVPLSEIYSFSLFANVFKLFKLGESRRKSRRKFENLEENLNSFKHII